MKAIKEGSETEGKKERRDEIVKKAIGLLVSRIKDPPWIAPLLRAQDHVEARWQSVARLRGHTTKDRLAVRRDAAARR